MNKEEIEEMSFSFPYTLKRTTEEIIPGILKSLEDTQFKDGVEFIEFLLQEFKKQQSELDIANKKLKDLKEYCKEDAEYWGNDSYINGLHEGYKDAINGVLSIIGGE